MSEHIKISDVELEAIRAELAAVGWTLLDNEYVECVQRFIHRVYVRGDKFAKVRFVPKACDAEYRVKVLTCLVQGIGFDLLVSGWEPESRLTVTELRQAFTEIWEGDPEQDGAINALKDGSDRKSLLTDPKACLEIASDLRQEMIDRAAICERYLDKLDRLQSWRGAIPKSALVFIQTWKPEQTIDFLKAWKPGAE